LIPSVFSNTIFVVLSSSASRLPLPKRRPLRDFRRNANVNCPSKRG
jgi:hypothetical protein